MTTGSNGPRGDRSHPESDAPWALALVLAGAGGSGIAALWTLLAGGGVLAAFLVYVLGTSVSVPVLAAAPHARRAAVAVRDRATGPRLARS